MLPDDSIEARRYLAAARLETMLQNCENEFPALYSNRPSGLYTGSPCQMIDFFRPIGSCTLLGIISIMPSSEICRLGCAW